MKKALLFCAVILVLSATQEAKAGNAPVQQYNLFSPDNNIQLKVYISNNRLLYTVYYNNAVVMQPSAMGLDINKVFTANAGSINVTSTNTINTTHTSRGVHSIAVDYCNEVQLLIKSSSNTNLFTVHAKAFNNGIAFRYLVNATDSNLMTADSTTFTLLPNSITWSQDDVNSYEASYSQRNINTASKGFNVGPPLLVQVTDNNNAYIAITEAGNTGFAGMSLKYNGNYRFNTILKGNSVFAGNIQTPWRVIEIGKDLNTLVNCDIIQNVSPDIDKSILPDGYATSWIAPGKGVWSWLSETDGGLFGVNYTNMQRYSNFAAQLGFQYNLVDEGWAYWSDGGKDYWALMKDLVDSSAKKNVKIFVWKSYGFRLGVAGIQDSVARHDFFVKCKETGIAGIKIDFFPGEQQATLKWYEDALKDAASLQLMIDFHGTDKPTGQSYTWPNEMTREGIRGLENPNTNWQTHNTTLPFTRFLAGHADYTPFSLNASLIKGTTLAHQLATIVTFTSPFMCIGANPDSLLRNPLKDIIEEIPTEWDETIVLPQSKPGVLSAFARRKGNNWYLAILNGPTKSTVQLNLSMLPNGTFNILTVQDDPTSPAKAVIKEMSVNNKQKFNLVLQPGGGFVATTQTRPVTIASR